MSLNKISYINPSALVGLFYYILCVWKAAISLNNATTIMQLRIVHCVHHLIPMAARSKAYVCSRSLPRIVGSNSAGGMYVCCECCVSGRGLCVGLIIRPEEAYRV